MSENKLSFRPAARVHLSHAAAIVADQRSGTRGCTGRHVGRREKAVRVRGAVRGARRGAARGWQRCVYPYPPTPGRTSRQTADPLPPYPKSGVSPLPYPPRVPGPANSEGVLREKDWNGLAPA